MTIVSIISAADYFVGFWKKIDHASERARTRRSPSSAAAKPSASGKQPSKSPEGMMPTRKQPLLRYRRPSTWNGTGLFLLVHPPSARATRLSRRLRLHQRNPRRNRQSFPPAMSLRKNVSSISATQRPANSSSISIYTLCAIARNSSPAHRPTMSVLRSAPASVFATSTRPVAARVAELVVDRLELVQVDNQHSKRIAVLRYSASAVRSDISRNRRLGRCVSGSRNASRSIASALRRTSICAVLSRKISTAPTMSRRPREGLHPHSSPGPAALLVAQKDLGVARSAISRQASRGQPAKHSWRPDPSTWHSVLSWQCPDNLLGADSQSAAPRLRSSKESAGPGRRNTLRRSSVQQLLIKIGGDLGLRLLGRSGMGMVSVAYAVSLPGRCS